MRPDALFPFYAPLGTLPGVGPRTAPLLAKAVGGEIIRDAAFCLPRALIDRRYRPKIAEAEEGRLATILVMVEAHEDGYAGRPYRVRCSDDTGFLTLVFFRPNKPYLMGRLKIGSNVIVVGEVHEKYGQRQMVHPARMFGPDDSEADLIFDPVYPAVAGIAPRVIGKACAEAAAHLPVLAEWIEPEWLKRQGWPSFTEALKATHHPKAAEDIAPNNPARMRLGYDELFARQLALQLAAQARRAQPSKALKGARGATDRLLDAFPFPPTGAQRRAFLALDTDLSQTVPMLRLLQGDVGSGKTLVAAYGMARAAEAGAQAALMAPTDILARQHFASLEPLLAKAGLNIALLTGKDTKAARTKTYSGLADGSIQAVVGTHALFQTDVRFADLGFIVVDEQHRFGVSDRKRLIEKGGGPNGHYVPHVLAMSATPIPRTLAMAIYGEVDVSILDEKPPGRGDIDTRVMPLEKMSQLEQSLERAILKDERVYWVCPLVEESETLDVSAATERFSALQARFGNVVELIHGRQKLADKEAAMARFRSGDAKILVATTVIEVGVDVPEATIMVIEHAERFGLAQLHQLRGRVGRGGKAGFCVLLYKPPLSEIASQRLQILRDTNDGFKIAEADFELRGGGDPLGLKQSGLPRLMLADEVAHKGLILVALDDARLLLHHDAALLSPRGKAARLALHLFEQQDAEALLGAG